MSLRPVPAVGGQEVVIRPAEGWRRRRCPSSEVGHPRHPGKPDQFVTAKRHARGGEEGTEQKRTFTLEGLPEVRPRSSVLVGDRRQIQQERPIEKIRPRHNFFDAVQGDRTGGLEDGLVGIGVELPSAESATDRNSAKGIGKPRWKRTHVIQGQQPARVRGDHHVAEFSRFRAQHGRIRIDEAPERFDCR